MPFGISFGGKKEKGKRYTDYWSEWQKQLGKTMGGQLQQGLTGDWQSRFAQPTPYEQISLGMLGDWMGSTPESWADAQGAARRAMTGEGYKDIIDPKRTEELYGAIESRTLKDILPKVLRSASGVANIGGMLRSGPGAQMQFDEMTKVSNKLAETLANLKYQDELQRRGISREREARQLQAIPAGLQIGELPLRQIQAGMGYGSLPRQLQGYQFDNPLMQAVMRALMLRGKADTRFAGSQLGGQLDLGGGWTSQKGWSF